MFNLSYAPEIDEEYTRGTTLLERLEKLKSSSKTGRRTKAELDWVVNLKWWAGEPWYRQNEKGTLEELLPQFRDRYVNVNMAFEVVETLTSRMVYHPKVESLPANSTSEARARARAMADIGNHCVWASKLYDAYARVAKLCHVCGYSWIKFGWDPTAGPVRPQRGQVMCPTCDGVGGVPSEVDGHLAPCPNCNQVGVVLQQEPILGHGMVDDVVGEEPEGEVFADMCAPWEVLHTPGVDRLEDAHEIIHAKLMSAAEAWMRYGSKVGLDEEDLVADTSLAQYPSMTWGIGSLWERQLSSDLVVVDEYWELPSQKYPHGLYGVAIGDKVISFGRLPYVGLRRLPFVGFTAYEVPGCAFPKSTVDLILPLIFQINDFVSSLVQRARQTSKLRMLAPDLSHFKMDDEQKVLTYKHRNGAPPPRELQLGAASSDTVNMIEMLKSFVERVSGSVDVLRGVPVQGAESARAFAWLEEQATTRLMPMIERHSDGILSVVQGMIDVVSMFYDEGRTLRKFGSHGHVENREFWTRDLGSPEDVRMHTVKDMMRSRAARMSDLFETKKIDGFNDPTFMDLAEFGSDNQVFDTKKMHEEKAMMENQTLKRQGVIDEPIPGEDHVIHVKMIDNVIGEIRMTDPASPLIGMALQHRRQHQLIKAQEAAEQQMDATNAMTQLQAQQAQQAQAYGMANAAAPGSQPAQAQAAGAPVAEALGNFSGDPESQASLQTADANAATAQAGGPVAGPTTGA